MKIVCDACQAKYSISDDKVQGKVFKIRCKKCSNIIVVRGGGGAAAEAPAPAPQEKDTRVYDYGYEGGDQPPAADDAVWHLVINQDQIGPMTVAEVQHRFAAGEVDAETFTWREGFADWLPLAQVDTFAALVASGSTTAAVGGGGHAAVAAMFGSSDDMGGGTSRNDPGDLFAAASAGSARGHDDDDGGDLFGSKPAASQAQSAANTKLRGERNENSVLFSLNNLAQLASDTPARSAPSSSASSSSGAGHATGQAGGEGSGLIDIRSMANAYLGGSGAAMGKPAASSGIGSIDDLPVFGGGGFSEPAVIVPSARAQSSNKVLYLMIGAVGLLAVVAVVMVIMLLKSSGTKAPQVAAGDDKTAKTGSDKSDTGSAAPDKADPTAGSAAAIGSAAATGSAAVTPPPNGSGSATQVAVADPGPKNQTPVPPPAHNPPPQPPAHHAPTHTGGTTPPPAHDPKPPKPDTTATKPDKPDSGGGCDEVSCVLNNYEGACCSKFRKGGGKAPSGGGGGGGDAPKPHSDLPDALDRSMISAGIANVKARVSSCGDKSPAKGKVLVHVKVGGDGKVANVSVSSSPDAALGACVAAAVNKASFGKTQGGGSFSYPFVF